LRAREEISATKRKKNQRAQVVESTQRNKNTTLEEKGIEVEDYVCPKIPTRWKKDRRSYNAAIRKMTVVEIKCQLAAMIGIVTARTQK